MAIGHDYADVPPTRGVYRGNASERLEVAVTVNDADAMNRTPTPTRLTWPECGTPTNATNDAATTATTIITYDTIGTWVNKYAPYTRVNNANTINTIRIM
jgi:hypothetical protein